MNEIKTSVIEKFYVKESVQNYYGEEINQSADLKTSACCTIDEIPDHVRNILPLIHDEIKTKYYGCGTAIPEAIDGLKVLDVGCGSGRDSYVMSKLVGENGYVFGIDMTKKQIEVAQKYVNDQMAEFGYKKNNIEFIHFGIWLKAKINHKNRFTCPNASPGEFFAVVYPN